MRSISLAAARRRGPLSTLLIGGLLVGSGVGSATVAAPEPAASPQFITCTGPSAGKVSCWSAEDDATDSIGGNDGSLLNGTTFGSGRVGKAFVFDGTDDLVSIPHAASLDFAPGERMSVSFWMFRTSSSPNGHVMGKRPACSGDSFNWQAVFYEDPSGDRFEFGDAFPNHANAGTLPPAGSWVHVVGTQSGARWRIYLGGDLRGTGAGMFGPTNTEPLLFGSSSTCFPYGGRLDEVQIWSRALSDDEVARIHFANGGCPTRPAAPTPLRPKGGVTVETNRPTLDWTARGCATTYRVVLRHGSATGPVVLRRTGLRASQQLAPALSPGETWVWRATACNSHGCRTGPLTTFKTAP